MLPSRSRLTRPISFVLAAAAALAISSAFHGCVTGSEIPNELTGTMVDANGTAQSEVKVFAYDSERIPESGSERTPVAYARTNAKGRYAFKDLAPGVYNVLAEKSGARAFQDSIIYTEKRVDAGADTLKAPGAISGLIRLEPHDNPRLALVQVIGTDIYVNVDSNGRFDLTDMAEGRYRIRVFVDETYVPEFRMITIRSGSSDTLPGIIEPFYKGEPHIEGLAAQALPDGSIRITWNKANSPADFTYAVFREAMDSPYYSGNAIRYFLTDTVFIDTVYSRTPRPDPNGFDPSTPTGAGVYGGQYPYEDTTAYRFRYRVMTFYAEGGEGGPPSGYVYVVAIPPTVPPTAALTGPPTVTPSVD